MDIILLAKFVPDVEKIPADAWDRERGTLVRAKLRMTFNPLDRVALNAALKIKAAQPGTKIIALTMGPQSAKFMLREALANGADEAVHLEDTKFAGSDTIATAYALAGAIKELVRRNAVKSNFVVFAGMQSSDGDTAQVPAQVASFLGAPLYPYFSALEAGNNEITLTCLNTIGTQSVTPRHTPFVATATKLFDDLPFYTSVQDIILANDKEISSYSAKALGFDFSRIGLNGSRTRVVKIFEPPQRPKSAVPVESAKNSFADVAAALLVTLKNNLSARPACDEPVIKTVLGAGNNFYSGDCLAICENNEDGLAPVSFEIASACGQFARQLGVKAIALVPGKNNQASANALREHGVNKVIFIEELERQELLVKESAEAFAEIIRQIRPQITIAPATLRGRVIAPYLSSIFDCGLTADCSSLDVGDQTVTGKTYRNVLCQTRPALGGNVMATIVSIYEEGSLKPQMATARPGALKTKKCYAEDFKIETASVNMKGSADSIQTVAQISEHEKIDIRKYKIVVCAGKGVASREKISNLIEPFRAALENYMGVPVGLGCSRAVVDSGVLSHTHQIGQTGAVVRPSIYIGIGVSGAIQHKIGMGNADTVVSINTDRDCAMSHLADHAIIGEAEKVLPVLTDILKNLRG